MKSKFCLLFLPILLSLMLTSCTARRKEPVDPTPSGPPVITGEPSGTPSQPESPTQPPSTPAEPTRPTQPTPQMRPRQPAKGDTASTKLVDNGVKEMNAGKLDSAEQMFEQALRVSPTNGRPYYYLGVVAAKQKEYQRSLEFLEQAETFLKDDDFWMSQIFLQEGLSLKALGRKDEARSRFKEALRRDPTNQYAQKELKQ